ncbi:hypothetical protein DPMN_006988 [Dreissena polymorpha]|uniref:Uncharacterized protein n=1 Tax=Dreissena polymorpha TaxID=45954 RepID=A0A9D4MTG7_DREPO|nr:hypothetical protein DPMN_006988 [Dreissena polymorpha]
MKPSCVIDSGESDNFGCSVSKPLSNPPAKKTDISDRSGPKGTLRKSSSSPPSASSDDGMHLNLCKV